jgi:hypothetical protein
MAISVTPLENGSVKIEGIVTPAELGPLKQGKEYIASNGKKGKATANRTYFMRSGVRNVPWGRDETASLGWQILVKASNFQKILSPEEQAQRQQQQTVNTTYGMLVRLAKNMGKSEEQARADARKRLVSMLPEGTALPPDLDAQGSEGDEEPEAIEA